MTRKKKKRRQTNIVQAPALTRETAFWEPLENSSTRARCTACNFVVETSRAVETGWTSTEYIAVRYHFCPICGRTMLVHGEPGP